MVPMMKKGKDKATDRKRAKESLSYQRREKDNFWKVSQSR